jgi:hypothetical protein
MRLRALLIGIGLLLNVLPHLAQETPATVPDLSGLNVAQATAALSRVGLVVGKQIPLTWTAESTALPDTVVAQSVAAGEPANVGGTVDITVIGVANVIMLYDDNDFTLINQVGRTLDLTQIRFRSADEAASLEATRWRSTVDSGDCLQVWAIARNSPKGIEGCDTIHWFTTTLNTTEHFWTELNGVTEFSMTINGETQITCPAALFGAEPARCAFFLPGEITAASTVEYLYMAYTIGQFALINRSTDQWLPLNQVRLVNFNPAAEVAGTWLTLDSPATFAPTVIGYNTLLLAPQQCVLMRDPRLSRDEPPPQDCIVVGTLSMEPSAVFWQADFGVENTQVGQRRQCPVATRDKLTLCILPRE